MKNETTANIIKKFDNIHMNIDLVVAPSATGKTTFLRKNIDFFDIDSDVRLLDYDAIIPIVTRFPGNERYGIDTNTIDIYLAISMLYFMWLGNDVIKIDDKQKVGNNSGIGSKPYVILLGHWDLTDYMTGFNLFQSILKKEYNTIVTAKHCIYAPKVDLRLVRSFREIRSMEPVKRGTITQKTADEYVKSLESNVLEQNLFLTKFCSHGTDMNTIIELIDVKFYFDTEANSKFFKFIFRKRIEDGNEL